MSASTTLLTDAQTMITNGATAATTGDAIAAGGPIMDYLGMQKLYQVKLKEIKYILQKMYLVTDSGDPNYTTLANDILTFS